MGSSSHDKKHKHKHHSHKHKKHHHKHKKHHKHHKSSKHKHRDKDKDTVKPSTDSPVNNVLLDTEDILLHQALVPSEAKLIDIPLSSSDDEVGEGESGKDEGGGGKGEGGGGKGEGDKTDAATGQLSNEHITKGSTATSKERGQTNEHHPSLDTTISTNNREEGTLTKDRGGSVKDNVITKGPSLHEESNSSNIVVSNKEKNTVESTDKSSSSKHKKEKERSKRRSRSRSRSRTRQRLRRRSRSGSRSKRRQTSRSRHRSRSGSRTRRRSRSGSKSRRKQSPRSRQRSRSGSRSRRRQSSRSRQRSRSVSRSRRRQRSQSGSRSRRRSRSGSRSRRRSRSGSRSRRSRRSRRSHSRRSSRHSSSPEKEEEVVNPFITNYPIPVIKTKADIIAEFTEFCRDLRDENKTNAGLNMEQYHPFQLAEQQQAQSTTSAPSITTPTQVVVDINAGIDTRPIEMRFPVSSGLQHQKEVTDEELSSTATTKPSVSVSDIISERALIQQRLLINPADTNSALLLQQLDTKLSQWCQGQSIPGRYTGCKEVTPMDKTAHKEGLQAWAKKKMFYGLRPVKAGFGMRLMMKMGWQYGQPLGKTKQGFVDPIPVDVKTDRQGLSTDEDKIGTIALPPNALPASENTPSCLQGKHPVSALQELCSKKGWEPPSYDIVSETGPTHMKTFVYKVRVNGESYQPSCGTNNKKLAKAQAALSCLKGLGLMSNNN